MSGWILVAYATRAGSTREVAEVVGEELRRTGARVDVRPVKDVDRLAGYEAVVLGTAIRLGKPLPEAVRFAQWHRGALGERPVAYFALCGTMQDDTPANRARMEKCLAVLRQVKAPVSEGLFAGALVCAKLDPPLRWHFRHNRVPEGDWRDWPRIRAWARETGELLRPRVEAGVG